MASSADLYSGFSSAKKTYPNEVEGSLNRLFLSIDSILAMSSGVSAMTSKFSLMRCSFAKREGERGREGGSGVGISTEGHDVRKACLTYCSWE
jgi:hypothetical protein